MKRFFHIKVLNATVSCMINGMLLKFTVELIKGKLTVLPKENFAEIKSVQGPVSYLQLHTKCQFTLTEEVVSLKDRYTAGCAH